MKNELDTTHARWSGTIFASFGNMRNAHTLAGSKGLDGRATLIGVGLTLGFMLIAGLIASLVPVPLVMMLLAAAAFVAAGAVTIRFRPQAHPMSPGLGAALATLLLAVPPLLFSAEPRPALSATQIAMSLLLSVLFAFVLAWTGARLAQLSGMRRPPRQDVPSSV